MSSSYSGLRSCISSSTMNKESGISDIGGNETLCEEDFNAQINGGDAIEISSTQHDVCNLLSYLIFCLQAIS